MATSATPVATGGDLVCNAGRQPQGNSMSTDKAYDIAVSARTTYLADQSDPDNGRHVFAYTIRITNNGNVAAQLVSRHWIITDADNRVQEVKGFGVIGEQPLLQPGETFEYSSGSVIATAVGTMRGSYQMRAADGTEFDATIPEFTLSMPRVLH
jgi:ApaG protein